MAIYLYRYPMKLESLLYFDFLHIRFQMMSHEDQLYHYFGLGEFRIVS